MKGATEAGMQTTWFVVASRAGARILERDGDEMRLVSELEHQAGRKKSSEIDADKPGRSFDRMKPGRHALSAEESSHDHVALGFARGLADALHKGRVERRFAQLVLVAEPKFLGMLRESLDSQTGSAVRDTVTKDLAHVPVRDLPKHLKDVLRAQ